MQPQRPKYLNLIQIRLPIPGIVSIAHRISGVLMFAAIPFFAYLLHIAVQGEAGFQQARALLDHIVVKAALLALLWSLAHHLFAGVRYLLIDIDVGVAKPAARASAVAVMALGLAAALGGAVLL